MKYIIYNDDAKSNTVFGCGGCFAIAVLFKDIKALGEEVYLSHEAQNVPLLPAYEPKDFLCNNEVDLDDCVTIYPEVTAGNPVGSKYVVRWLLHYPGFFNNNNTTWHKEKELFFTHAPWITKKSEELGYSVSGLLAPVHYNHDVFKDYGLVRNGTCFVVRKGPVQGSSIDRLPEGSADLQPLVNMGNPQHLAEVLNRYENFYSYDENSILSLLAVLCGCNSIVASQSQTEEDFLSPRHDGWKCGVAYGAKNIEKARATKHLLKQELLKEEERGLNTVKQFLSHIKEKNNWPF